MTVNAIGVLKLELPGLSSHRNQYIDIGNGNVTVTFSSEKKKGNGKIDWPYITGNEVRCSLQFSWLHFSSSKFLGFLDYIGRVYMLEPHAINYLSFAFKKFWLSSNSTSRSSIALIKTKGLSRGKDGGLGSTLLSTSHE